MHISSVCRQFRLNNTVHHGPNRMCFVLYRSFLSLTEPKS